MHSKTQKMACQYSMFVLLFCTMYPACLSCKDPVIFVFGDSNSDTGGKPSFEGTVDMYPYGRVFKAKPSGRQTDGRLILDYLCEHLKIGYLSSYLNSFNPNFKHGVNFAISGAIIGNPASFDCFPTRYTLDLQLIHFKRFHNLSIERESSVIGTENSITKNKFEKALYILDLGQNDLSGASDNNTSYDQIVQTIPPLIFHVEGFITSIYQIGGRRFWIHNISPQGCFPFQKAKIVNNTDLDTSGCITYLNDASRKFNQELDMLVQKLRAQLVGSTLVLVDIFTSKYELISNAALYGFMDPFTKCIEHMVNCIDGSKYISFDGVHLTDAANAVVAEKILSRKYSNPPLPIDFFCT